MGTVVDIAAMLEERKLPPTQPCEITDRSTQVPLYWMNRPGAPLPPQMRPSYPFPETLDP